MFRDCVVLLFIIIVKKTVVKFLTRLLRKQLLKTFNMFSYDLLISFDDLIDTFEKKNTLWPLLWWIYYFALFKSNLF
jgi:hypothetical protein